MNPTTKLLIGVLTLAPAVGIVWTLAQMIITFVEVAEAGGSAEPEQLLQAIRASMAVAVVTSVITLALICSFIWHLMTRAKRRDTGFQVLWCLLLVLFSVVALPVYWSLYLWPEAERPIAAR